MFIYVIALHTPNGLDFVKCECKTMEFATFKSALRYAHFERLKEFSIMREVYSVRANEWVPVDDLEVEE